MSKEQYGPIQRRTKTPEKDEPFTCTIFSVIQNFKSFFKYSHLTSAYASGVIYIIKI